MNNTPLDSKDYDVDAVKNYDPRFEEGKRDATFLHVLGIIATVIATVWMYALGTGDPKEMSYFLGFPLWVSGAVLIYLVMFAIGMIYICRWKNFSFAARDAASEKGDK